MSQTPYSNHSHDLTILFEAIPEDEHHSDPAVVEAMGREVVAALRNDGYTVEPVYTGQRGGGLYEILPAVQATFQYAITYKDQVIELFKAIKPIVTRVAEVREKQLALDEKQADGIKVEFSLGKDQSFKGESPNLAGNEIIAELAKEFMHLHVQIVEQEAPRIVEQDMPRSVVKISESVPKRKTRRRH